MLFIDYFPTVFLTVYIGKKDVLKYTEYLISM